MGSGEPIELDPDRAAWERQPGETARAYSLFLMYLNPDAPERVRRQRSVKQVSEEATISALRTYQYSSLGRWAIRARAYDDAANAEWFAGIETERTRMARLFVEELDGLMDNLATVRAVVNGAIPAQLLPGDYARHLNTAANVFRTVLGPAPETVHHAGPEGGPVEVDFHALDQMGPEQLAEFMAGIQRAAEESESDGGT